MLSVSKKWGFDSPLDRVIKQINFFSLPVCCVGIMAPDLEVVGKSGIKNMDQPIAEPISDRSGDQS